MLSFVYYNTWLRTTLFTNYKELHILDIKIFDSHLIFTNTRHINYFMNNVSDKQTKRFQENLKTELRFSGYHVSFSPNIEVITMRNLVRITCKYEINKKKQHLFKQ